MKSSLHSEEDYNSFKSKSKKQEESESNDDEDSPPTPPPKPRVKTLRGAALRSATTTNPENDDTNKDSLKSISNEINLNLKEQGIYANKLYSNRQAHRDMMKKVINEEYINAKKKIETKNKENRRKINVLSSSSGDSDTYIVSGDDSSDDSTVREKKLERKRKQGEKMEASNTKEPSPSSSPEALAFTMSFKNSKLKRKYSSMVNKKLNDLDQFLNKNKNLESSINDAEDDCLDVEDLITVRVSTKFGTKKFEINENQTFQQILDELAVLEQTSSENLVLMLKDQTLKFYDTPLSVNLKTTDILNVKTTRVAQERIKICCEESDTEEDDKDGKLVKIILQTTEGRKSRVKLQVVRDEPFKNILKKYCEHKSLDWASGTYILEFDGDLVKPNETANDLDLDGDECFDVKQSSKSSMQFIQGNKKNYDFDEDILTM